MKIAIISDTHDNVPNLTKMLDYCREHKVEKLIHCGDLAEIETLDFIKENFAGDIFWTFGNMDRGHAADYPFADGKYRSINIFSKHGEVEIANKKIAFVHFPEYARRLAEEGRFDYVFYGHTHKPWTEKIRGENKYGNVKECEMLNPGNTANLYYPPTFAVWNTLDNLFSLIRINGLT
jgi:putative phosphoesterase